MPKFTERKMWDARSGTYMRYPGIPPVQIEVGTYYRLVFVDSDGSLSGKMNGYYTVERASSFKTTGRRWTIRDLNWKGVGSCSYLWESEILEQDGRMIVLGAPWNYAKFNQHHADHKIPVS
jgi:hypothetical protein